LIATHEGSTLEYHHNDHLSMRVTTDTDGAVVAQSGHYPFGENWYETGGTNKLKFTSYERDSESSNDYAMFRTHIPRFGRFSAADPIAGSPYNPQSLNRYAYVMNDPIDFIDPLGLSCYSSRDAGQAEPTVICVATGLGGSGGPTCTLNEMEMDCARALRMVGIFSIDDLIRIADTPTEWRENPACPNGDCAPGVPKFLPVYGNSDLLGLLGLFNTSGRGAGGTPQQPTKTDRAKTCAKAYYDFNTLPGAAQDATRIALIPAAPIIPKAAVGLPQALGSGPLTNLLSWASLGSGTAASGANIFRAAGRIGGPIAIATAVIDATAIATCTFIDQ